MEPNWEQLIVKQPFSPHTHTHTHTHAHACAHTHIHTRSYTQAASGCALCDGDQQSTAYRMFSTLICHWNHTPAFKFPIGPPVRLCSVQLQAQITYPKPSQTSLILGVSKSSLWISFWKNHKVHIAPSRLKDPIAVSSSDIRPSLGLQTGDKAFAGLGCRILPNQLML